MRNKIFLYIDEMFSEVTEIMIGLGFVLLLIGAVPLLCKWVLSIAGAIALLVVAVLGIVIILFFFKRLPNLGNK